MTYKMKKKLFLLTITLTVTLLVGVGNTQSFALRNLNKGDTIQNYGVTLLDGTTTNITELLGEKGLLIVFWATWSERSLQLLKYTEMELKDNYHGKGINFLGINVEHQDITGEDEEKISQAVETLGITIPLGIDRNMEIFNEIGVISVPTSVLITKDLILEDAYPGFPTIARDDVPSLLNAFLGIEEKKAPEEARYLLAKKPKNNALLYYNLGKNLYKRYLSLKGELKKTPKNAIDKLDESIKRDPDYYSPYLLKAIIYHKAKEEDKRDEVLKIIEEKGFTDHIEVRDLAYMSIIIDMNDRSKAFLSKLKEENAEEPTIMLLEALLAVEDNRMDEASTLFKGIMVKGNLSFDLDTFIEPETGEIYEGKNPDGVVRQIAEKVLNISKK